MEFLSYEIIVTYGGKKKLTVMQGSGIVKFLPLSGLLGVYRYHGVRKCFKRLLTSDMDFFVIAIIHIEDNV